MACADIIGTLGYMLLENTGFWMGLSLTILTVFTVSAVSPLAERLRILQASSLAMASVTTG